MSKIFTTRNIWMESAVLNAAGAAMYLFKPPLPVGTTDSTIMRGLGWTIGIISYLAFTASREKKNSKMKKALACSILSGDLYVIGTRLYAFSQGWISSTDKTFEIVKIGLSLLEAAGMTYCYLEASDEEKDE